mgnify:FL=1
MPPFIMNTQDLAKLTAGMVNALAQYFDNTQRE